MAEESMFEISGEVKPGNSIKLNNKQTGNSYDITIGKNNQHACSCPGFQFRGSCKHIDHVIAQFPAKTDGEDSDFKVEGEPNFSLNTTTGTAKDNLVTILKQRIEEARQKDKTEKIHYTANPNAEFKPENQPFIPDKTHPLLTKHEHTKPEHVAGFIDASQVPAMYKDSIRPPAPDKLPDTNQQTLVINSSMSPSVNNGPNMGTKSPGIQAPTSDERKIEFKLNISREQMNKGGHYMPNESRPYRPGDTK